MKRKEMEDFLAMGAVTLVLLEKLLTDEEFQKDVQAALRLERRYNQEKDLETPENS